MKLIRWGLVVACLGLGLLAAAPKTHDYPRQTPAPTASSAPTATPSPLPVWDRAEELEEAVEVNGEVIGWLVVPGTEIDGPVTQSRDNQYYLTHNWKGERDLWGSYFGDYINDFSSRETLSTNNVIYGHSYNREDPTLPGFTQLFAYKEISFLRQNPCFYLYLPGGEELVFQVVGVFYTDTGFDYINPRPDREEKLDYYAQVEKRNLYLLDGITFGPEDTLMTLSTCAYAYDTEKAGDQRFVVLGKLLEPGALPLTLEIRKNPDPLGPES